MIKVKVFQGYYKEMSHGRRVFIEPDQELNEFLEKEDIFMLDVKMASHEDDVYAYRLLLIYSENYYGEDDETKYLQ